MDIILHAGAHCTNSDKLLKGALRNADMVRHDGVAIPGPSRYRQLISETMNVLATSAPQPDARDVMLDAILNEEPDQIQRLVLSNESFFCVPKLLLAGGQLYRKAEQRLQTMVRLFPQDQLHLYIGLRNPATLLPAVYAASPQDGFHNFLDGVDPRYVLWSGLLNRIRADVPQVRITTWCNEDTPLIWGPLIRDVIGIAPGTKISGSFDLLHEIMSEEGMKRFRAFLKEHPTINEEQKRKVMVAFLDKYALDDAIEEELDLPGWDDAFVDGLTDIYEADVAQIMQMDGVRVMVP